MAKLVPLSGWRQHVYLTAKARRLKRVIDKPLAVKSKTKNSGSGRLPSADRLRPGDR